MAVSEFVFFIQLRVLGIKMNEEWNDFLRQLREEYREKTFFIEQNLGAEVHWFFTQAVQALKSELYLPACTSFLVGIEASLRVTMHQIHSVLGSNLLTP